jgi:NADPH-dependent curcumin reductase CurA
MVFDHYCKRADAEEKLSSLLKAGRLKAPVTELTGFEALPAALVSGPASGKLGKLNVRIA